MKTKFLFASMVLATTFAACTNEEIVENVAGNDLQERVEFNAPAITVGSGVDSRFAWDETAGAWEKFTANDKFGGGLMDASKFTTVGEAPLTNYIFSSTDGVSFTTTSKMKEGTYFFYSYPGFEKESEREAIPFDLTASQKEIDLTNPAANVNAHQLFVSSLYKVEAENADLALPIQFYSYWSTAALKIKNATSEDFKIVRIVLAGAANDQFMVKGTLKPSALGTVAKKNEDNRNLVYYCENGKYVLPYVGGDATKGRVNADDIRLADIATADADGKQGAIMVDVKNGTVAAGETAVAYIQMPADEYAEGSITAKIHVEVYDEVEEENVVKELEAEFVTNYTDPETEVESIRIRRAAGYNAFGKEPFAIDELSLNVATEGIGAYAASYEDLYQLVVKEDQTKIYNIGSLKLDDQAITLFNRLAEKNAAVTYKFQNPIVITSDKKSVSLNNVEFLSGATLEKGKLTLGNAAVVTGKTLVVNDNAELTIAKTQAGTIENHNKVIVNAAATGVITVGNNEEGVAHTTEIVIAYKTAAVNIAGMAAPNQWTINKDVTVTLPTDYSNPWGTTIVNNGTLNNTSKFINKGAITNNATGVIKAVRNIGSYDSSRTTNKLQSATIDNYGVIESLMPFEYSLVTMKTENAVIENVYASDLAADKGGEIDNSLSGYVTLNSDTKTVVYKKYTTDVTGNLPMVQAQNAAKIEGCTWDLTGAATTAFTKGIEFNNAVVKYVDANGERQTFDFGTSIVKAKNTVFNCVPTIQTTAETAEETFDLSGSTFKGKLNLNAAKYATLNGVTFEAGADMNALMALNLYGTVNVKGNLSATAATAVEIGKKNADATYTSTNVKFEGNVTATSASTVSVLKSAKMSLAVGMKFNAKAATTYTVNGVVDNRGKIQGASATVSGTNAKWNGAQPAASI